MVQTASTMIPLGTRAPDFNLPNVVSGKHLSLNLGKGERGTVIMFICNHCPYVKHILPQLVIIANAYREKGIAFIAINANDIKNYPEDAPEKMKQLAESLGNPFPYLFDETQNIARSYKAVCTPDFFVFDRHLACVYRGQFDDSRPGGLIPPTGKDLRVALDCVGAGQEVNIDQKPSLGCNIKWKSK